MGRCKPHSWYGKMQASGLTGANPVSTCVCACVCMRVHPITRTYVCTHMLCVHTCVHMCAGLCGVCGCFLTSLCVRVHACVPVCVCPCVSRCVFVCVCWYMRVMAASMPWTQLCGRHQQRTRDNSHRAATCVPGASEKFTGA